MRHFFKALLKLPYLMIPAIILLPLVVASQTKAEKYTLDFYHLRGKVGYMEEIKYSAEESVNGLQKGKVLQKDSYRFDTAGNLLDEEMYFGTDFRRNTYTYSKSGKLLADESYNERGLSDFSTFDYDITGSYLTGKTMYYKNGSVSSRINYQYDARGNRTEVIAYSRDGRMTSKTTYIYNAKGYLTEEHLNNVEPSPLEVTWISGYDDKGNRIELERYSSGKPEHKQTFSFDDNKKTIEENTLNPDGTVKKKITNQYDDKGNKTEINEFSPPGTLKFKTAITYDYDTNGNWVNSTHSINETPTYIYERKIIYHP